MKDTKFKKVIGIAKTDSTKFSKGDLITLRRNKNYSYVYNVRANGETFYGDDLILDRLKIKETN